MLCRPLQGSEFSRKLGLRRAPAIRREMRNPEVWGANHRPPNASAQHSLAHCALEGLPIGERLFLSAQVDLNKEPASAAGAKCNLLRLGTPTSSARTECCLR